jgi:hypothetical protein
MTRLEESLDVWQSRLLRVKLSNQTVVAPSPEEILALTERAADPLISRVAGKLVAVSSQSGENSALAGTALRLLHGTIHRTMGGN